MERHTTRACSGTYDGKDHAEMRGVAMSSLPICVRRATVDDAPTVSALAQRLLTELGGFPLGDPEALVSFCRQLLASEQYHYSGTCLRGGEGKLKKRLKKKERYLHESLKRGSSQF